MSFSEKELNELAISNMEAELESLRTELAAAKAELVERGEECRCLSEQVQSLSNDELTPFNPYTNIADCADMEAALFINTHWEPTLHEVKASAHRGGLYFSILETYKTGADKQRARMAASCAVAVMIGRKMREGK